MKDKDFKEQNNYREVECCGNCKTNLSSVNYCVKNGSEYKDLIQNKPSGRCDKWEHE